jgi:hypothetical protein
VTGRRVGVPTLNYARAGTPTASDHAALEQIWQLLAKALLTRKPRSIAMNVLAVLIERRIRADFAKTDIVPALLAAHIAGGQLAMLDEWLSGRHGCPSSLFAKALHSTSSAALRPSWQTR